MGTGRKVVAGWASGVLVLTAFAAAGQGAPPASAPALDPVADRILTRLEERQVEDLKARVSWKRTYTEAPGIEETDEQVGEIFYKQGQPCARFLVHFTHKIVAGRRHKLDEKHLFDGRWYVELQSRTQPGTVTRREIRPPGDRSDPYRIGEGVFPVPFGQRKADILAEFDVSRDPALDDEQTEHLRLIPRPGTRTAERYAQVDLWIARQGRFVAGLPVKVVAINQDSGQGAMKSSVTVQFSDVQLNNGLSDKLFQIQTPPGFQEYVEPYQEVRPPEGISSDPPGRP